MGLFNCLKKSQETSTPPKCENEQEKNYFYTQMKGLLEENLLREVYAGERLSIMNIANTCYVIFDFAMCYQSEHLFGIIMGARWVKRIAKKEMRFYRWAVAISTEEVKKYMLVISEKNIEVMRNLKAKSDKDGPGKDVDLQMEKDIMAKKLGRN